MMAKSPGLHATAMLRYATAHSVATNIRQNLKEDKVQLGLWVCIEGRAPQVPCICNLYLQLASPISRSSGQQHVQVKQHTGNDWYRELELLLRACVTLDRLTDLRAQLGMHAFITLRSARLLSRVVLDSKPFIKEFRHCMRRMRCGSWAARRYAAGPRRMVQQLQACAACHVPSAHHTFS